MVITSEDMVLGEENEQKVEMGECGERDEEMKEQKKERIVLSPNRTVIVVTKTEGVQTDHVFLKSLLKNKKNPGRIDKIKVIRGFTKEEDRREKWLTALRRSKFEPTKASMVCSEHFRWEDFDRTSPNVQRIIPEAIPSVFRAFPSYLQNEKKIRRLPTKRTSSVAPPQPQETSPHLRAIDIDTPVTPERASLKRKLEKSTQQLVCSRKKIKTLMQARRRLQKQNSELKNVIDDLRNQAVMSSSSIVEAKLEDKPLPVTYSPELRSFALTLHFYSPRAYNYVRKVFDTCLPHPRTIGKWYHNVNGEPGFTSTAFEALQIRSEAKGEKLLCALMMDEVAIHQKIEFDGKKYEGYIDMGTHMDNDSLPVAKEALTMMVVDLQWKLHGSYLLDIF